MKYLSMFLALGLLVASCKSDPKKSDKDDAAKQDTAAPKTKFTPAEKIFFPTGELMINGKMIDGKRNGVWTSWYKSGKRNSELTYFKDVEDGEYHVWFETGQEQIVGKYKKGTEIGTWYFFNEKGDTLNVIDFDKKNAQKK